MSRYPFVTLQGGKDSCAYYAENPASSLVIFVHGFKGEAVSTWDDFPDFFEDKFPDTDILFYGYDSMKGQAFDQSEEFYTFLNRNASSAAVKVRKKNKDYEKIVIVGHSLGAVVIRYALLKAIDQDKKWRNQCRLFLFAPAHTGARIQNLIFLSLPSFFKVLGGLALFRVPILDDLRPGSLALKRLETETEKYKDTAEKSVLKARVLHVNGDLVVHNNRFCFDEVVDESPLKGHSHTSVCKPRINDYVLPVEYILKLL